MHPTRWLIVLLALLACTSCESLRDHWMEAEVKRDRAKALAKIDQPACLAKGGHIGYYGMFGTPVCAIAFADAGKTCSDKADCQGRCLVENSELEVGSAASGKCEADDHTDGCYAEVRQGKVGGGMCFE